MNMFNNARIFFIPQLYFYPDTYTSGSLQVFRNGPGIRKRKG